MLKKYLISIFILSFVPNLIYSMEIKTECEKVTPTTFENWQQLPLEMKAKVLNFSDLFVGIVDPSKSVEENIKKLFARRAELMLNKDFRKIITGASKERIYNAIGDELSKLIQVEPLGLPYDQIGRNMKGLVKAISDFSNNKEVIKALKDIKFEPYGSTLLYVAAAILEDITAVQILIESGANINAKNYKGKTALDFIKNNKIKQLLICQGAKSGKDLP